MFLFLSILSMKLYRKTFAIFVRKIFLTTLPETVLYVCKMPYIRQQNMNLYIIIKSKGDSHCFFLMFYKKRKKL